MSRVDSRIEEGRALITQLKAEGRHREAEVIRRLIGSLVTMRSNNQILHRDNLALRGEITELRGRLA